MPRNKVVCVQSERAGQRVMASSSAFLERRLKLKNQRRQEQGGEARGLHLSELLWARVAAYSRRRSWWALSEPVQSSEARRNEYFERRALYELAPTGANATNGSGTARNRGHPWRTRLQPIRTVSEIELDFVVFTQDLFPFQAIAAEAQAMRRLGMTLQAIARALGVSEKTVWKAVAR